MLRARRPRCEPYRQLQGPSDCKFRFSTPARAAKSRRPSPPSCATGPMPFLSLVTRSSLPGGSKLRRSGARPDSHELFRARDGRSGPADELWDRSFGHVASGWRLYRSNPQGREARRPAGLAVDQIRIRHQRANGQGARHRGAAAAARQRRRGDRVKRREFIMLLGGAAAAWPLAAHAQERLRRIGVLMNLASDDPEGQDRVAAFMQGLQESGWAVGRNVRVDYRWGAGDTNLFRKYAAELVAL